jgi:hypothetical protein
MRKTRIGNSGDDAMPSYDKEADARLKAIGYELINQLRDQFRQLTATDTMTALGQAMDLAKAAVGFLPIGDGPNKMSDEEIAAAIRRVDAILAIIAMYQH